MTWVEDVLPIFGPVSLLLYPEVPRVAATPYDSAAEDNHQVLRDPVSVTF